MKFLIGLAFVLVASFLADFPVPGLAAQQAGHVSLVSPCGGFEIAGRCNVIVSIIGPITQADADAFRSLLESEAHRSGMPIKPLVEISSMGGDVQAAMQIGRDIRRTEGAVLSGEHPCYSACVLVAAGGVQRLVSDVGIHRPYFADSSTSNLAEADARYKRLMAEVRAYIGEMNMSEEIFHIMETIAPEELKRLDSADVRRLGFMGSDPAFDEVQIAEKARAYHLSSATYRQRLAQIESVCGKPGEASSVEEMSRRERCAGQTMDAVMWGVDPATLAQIDAKITERCSKFSPPSSPWAECSGDVGFAVKQGYLQSLPPDFAGVLRHR